MNLAPVSDLAEDFLLLILILIFIAERGIRLGLRVRETRGSRSQGSRKNQPGPSMSRHGHRIADYRGKAALKTHALQTLTRGPLTRPRARSVWSASDLSALSLRHETVIGSRLPTPSPSQEGNRRLSAGSQFPSWEGLGVGSGPACAKTKEDCS